MSHRLEFPPEYYRQVQDGADYPVFPAAPARPKPCRLCVRDHNGTEHIYGTFEQSPLRIAYDLSSQMPLITLGIRQDEHVVVELAYDCSNFLISHAIDATDVDDAIEQLSGNIRSDEHRQLAMVELVYKNAGRPCPVVKTSHPGLLRPDLRKVYDALIKSSGVRVFRVLHPGVPELFRFFEGIIDARATFSSRNVTDSDYWHYTKEEGYSDVPGYRLAALDEDRGRDTVPPHWMATVTRQSNLGIRVPVQWGRYVAKDTFQNMHEYEMVMGVALRHEREQARASLEILFNPEVHHAAKFERVASNRPHLAWIYVDINQEQERQKMIPPSGTRVRVSIWREGLTANPKDDWEGTVRTIATVSDFAILAEAPRRVRDWSEGPRRITLQAVIDLSSINRGIKHTQNAICFKHDELPADEQCGRFDLQRTLLAHGPYFDQQLGEVVDLTKLIFPDKTLFNKVLADFTLDPSQQEAFKASTVNLVAGLSLIQGPPGTGKTRVNACIALTLATMGIKVLATAASNMGVQQLLLTIIRAAEANPEVSQSVKIILMGTPSSISEKAVEMSINESSTTAEQLQATAELGYGLSTKELVIDPQLLPYTMANQILDYVKAKRDTDDDCKKWWQLRNHIVVDKRIAKDKDYRHFLDINEKLTKVILMHSKVTIVASTLNNTASKVLRNGLAPQLLLIDEAGQSLEADNVIAMTLPSLRAVVLTGDQKQLAPTVLSMQSTRNPYALQLSTSLFTRLVERRFPYRMLTTNYRMHPDIADLPNREAYGSRLINAPNTSAPNPVSQLWLEFCRDTRMCFGVFAPGSVRGMRRIFINVNGIALRHPGSTSLHNPANVKVVRKLLWDLLSFRSTDPLAQNQFEYTNVGVITPYNDEKRAILRELAADANRLDAPAGLNRVRVATVDGFQGFESDIIILDLTAANAKSPERIGFVGEARRLNVSLTRAKHAFIIIGNMRLWWEKILQIRDKSNRPEFGSLLADIRRLQHQVDWPANQTETSLYTSDASRRPSNQLPSSLDSPRTAGSFPKRPSAWELRSVNSGLPQPSITEPIPYQTASKRKAVEGMTDAHMTGHTGSSTRVAPPIEPIDLSLYDDPNDDESQQRQSGRGGSAPPPSSAFRRGKSPGGAITRPADIYSSNPRPQSSRQPQQTVPKLEPIGELEDLPDAPQQRQNKKNKRGGKGQR